ncbi:MAG: ribosome maturation factor RimM [Chloroflexota bacterium]|nr:16S rRNA processing protein RimM [Chloroflexota bacterium]
MPEQRKPRPEHRYDRTNSPKRRTNAGPHTSHTTFRSSQATSIPNSSPPSPSSPKVASQVELPAFDFLATELQYVIVAEISAPFGLRGAVKANMQTDFPDRFERMEEAFLAAPHSPLNAPRECYKLLSARVQNEKQVILRFEGITKTEQAEKLRGYTVAVPRSEVVELSEGEYYIFQIIGLEVYTVEGEYIGKVVNVEQMTSNDVYFVRGPKSSKDILLPAIKDVIKQVDLEAKRITIAWMEGLI